MDHAEQPILPQWAPRVPQHKIRQLYELDAQGIYDEELIQEVGYALRARCQSFIEACQAWAGCARCPVCGAQIPHTGDKAEVLRCGACGWALTWGEYFKTFQHKQLSGAEPVLALFREFVERFPPARTLREKMLLIDRLLHGFHWYHKFGPTRPVAVNLIEGRLTDVVRFLDRLSYGEGGTPGTQETHAEWVARSENTRRWLGLETAIH
jgi:hypothetical protein